MPTLLFEDKSTLFVMPDVAKLLIGMSVAKHGGVRDLIVLMKPEYTPDHILEFLDTGEFVKQHKDIPDPDIAEMLKAQPIIIPTPQDPTLDKLPSRKQKAKAKKTEQVRKKLGLSKKKRKVRSDKGKKHGPRKKKLDI